MNALVFLYRKVLEQTVDAAIDPVRAKKAQRGAAAGGGSQPVGVVGRSAAVGGQIVKRAGRWKHARLAGCIKRALLLPRLVSRPSWSLRP